MISYAHRTIITCFVFIGVANFAVKEHPQEENKPVVEFIDTGFHLEEQTQEYETAAIRILPFVDQKLKEYDFEQLSEKSIHNIKEQVSENTHIVFENFGIDYD